MNNSEESFLKNKPSIQALGPIRTARALFYALLLVLSAQSAHAEAPAGLRISGAQPDSSAHEASLAPDADEADTTEYESIRSTPYEQAALIGANAILLPIAVGAAAVSVFPPNLGMVIDDGIAYAAVGFETGVGIGTKQPTGKFADARIMLNYTHVYNRHRHDLWRIEAVKDQNLFFIDRRNIFAFGVSPMLGLYTDGPKRGYSVGSSLRLMLPSLPYFGMFPLHTIGITYRYNQRFGGGSFHTLSLGVSAAVTF